MLERQIEARKEEKLAEERKAREEDKLAEEKAEREREEMNRQFQGKGSPSRGVGATNDGAGGSSSSVNAGDQAGGTPRKKKGGAGLFENWGIGFGVGAAQRLLATKREGN